ncbi:hypothetical protein [Altererythrobacter sp. ZODW24]|uniref:hypothetical protein n=1 Tax=Altererythrobacter sp. ZODW24 TaxID=2185142 RepID=UPI000DF76CB5|nr:hypothetical protein [Altererythrobacter sp. ZODW24]
MRKLVLAASLLGAGCVTQSAAVDWNLAGSIFAAGEADAPMAYSVRDASRCVGWWQVHHDALDSFTISIAAAHLFPDDLRQMRSLSAAEFFRLDPIDERAYQSATKQAEAQLRRAVAGDADAFQRYFEALGKCSTQPEAVGDATGDAIDTAADE